MPIRETLGVSMGDPELQIALDPVEQAKREEVYLLTQDPSFYTQAEQKRLDDLLAQRKTIDEKTTYPNLEARREMARRIKNIRKKFAEVSKTGSLPEILRQFCMEEKLNELDDAGDAAFISMIANERSGLLSHLDETTQAASNFLIKLLFIQRAYCERNKIPFHPILSARQVKLIARFVAPTHDLIKLTGAPNGQIDSDHEHVLQELIQTSAVDKRVYGLSLNRENQGQYDPHDTDQVLTQSDVNFSSKVVGFHEDIWREDEFEAFTSSFGKERGEEVDDPVAIERARMLFHIIDIFGQAVKLTDTGEFVIEHNEKFEDRFVDLYRRHINLNPIGNEIDPGEGDRKHNWSRGKVFRPLWGLYAVKGVEHTLEQLKAYGVTVSPETLAKIRESMKQVLLDAKLAVEQSGNSEELKEKYEEIIRVLKEFDGRGSLNRE